MRNIALYLAASALLAVSAFAQETRGTLVGKATDASGGAMPAVRIVALNGETGVESNTTTNGSGLYQLRYLLPGHYKVTAEAAGFKTLVRDGIEIRINDRVELTLRMEVGTVQQRVEVTGETPLLETAGASIGQVIDHRRIVELPLMHGNPMGALEMGAGMSQTRPSEGLWSTRVFDNAYTASYAIDGASRNSSEITLDGVSNTTTTGGLSARNQQTVAYTPPADLVEELKVQTATFDASVGYTSGAIINMSVKPGTRNLHGTADFFKISPELNANQWFANRAGVPKTDYAYKRWGGTATGPVWLPKIYNGREKTFFAYGYEGHHDAPPWPQTLTVPTAKQAGGDFSDLLNLGSRYQIYDPMSARPAANGRIQRDAFANNIIPTNRISPFAKALLGYWPAPRTAGTADGGSNFPDPNQPDPNFYYSHVARIDHNFAAANRLYGRVAVSKLVEHYRNAFQNPATGNNIVRQNRGFTLDDVHTFSPRMVLNLRWGYTRFREGHIPDSLGFDPAAAGFSKELIAMLDPQTFTFPCIRPSGLNYLGCVNPDMIATDIHSGSASVDSLRGPHNLKFGGETRIYRRNQYSFGQGVPRMDFGTDYTRGPYDNSASAPNGQGFAAFLLGVPSGGYVQRNASYAEQSGGFSLYFQDDWKVSHNLTITLGLRYEYEGPVTERFNRSVRDYDFSTASPIEAAAKANYASSPIPELPLDRFRLIGGLRFANVGDAPRGLYNSDPNNFMPRIGLAWKAANKTVVRAGYGIFYGFLGARRGDVNQAGFSQQTNFVPTIDNGLTFQYDLRNPFPNGILNPVGAANGLSTYLGNGISYTNPDLITPYMQRWQFGVQRELPARVLLDLAYVGNRGTKLETARDLNALGLQWLSRSPARDQARIDSLSALVTNPLYPMLAGSALGSKTISRAQLLVAYPQFASISTTNNQGYSWYHSLQLKVDRRFANGFTLQSSYTYSKFMDATGYLNGADPVPERVISGEDYPHRFSMSGIYELPFGRNKPLARNISRVANGFISGWQVQGIYTGQSGPALGFGGAILYGSLQDIPLPNSQRTVDRWFNTKAGFETNSSKQLGYNVRTMNSRFNNVRGDGVNTFNLSVLKNIALREGMTAQFRGEAINAMNHVMFAAPNTNPTSSGFGMITDERSNGRAIQLGLKFLF
jgi:hypothetical protein